MKQKKEPHQNNSSLQLFVKKTKPKNCALISSTKISWFMGAAKIYKTIFGVLKTISYETNAARHCLSTDPANLCAETITTFNKDPGKFFSSDKLYLQSKYTPPVGLKWFACLCKQSIDKDMKKNKKKDQAQRLFSSKADMPGPCSSWDLCRRKIKSCK